MANALINAFLGDQRASMSSGRQVAADWLWQELRQLDLEVRDEDAKIQAFRREKGLMRGANAPIASERLTSISQQLFGRRGRARRRRREAAGLKADQAGGSANAPAVLGNRAVADIKQQIAVATAQLATAASTYGPITHAARASAAARGTCSSGCRRKSAASPEASTRNTPRPTRW